ncbi:MAG: glycosyltransferase, partial [Microbacteriaceae bacterium]|nr:glycosyltransferase [Burkholderiaceae bacterium]
QGLRLAPGDRECLRQLGNVLLAGSRHGQAQLAFMKILEDEPGHPAVTLELAEVRRRAGQFAAGLDALAPVLRARPGWYPALLARARLLAEGGLAGADDACAEVLRRDRHCADGVRVALRLVGLGSEPARRLLSLVPADLLRRTWREAIIAAVHTQGHACLERLVQVARADLDEDGWTETAALYAASLTSGAEPDALALQARHWYRALKLRNGLTRLPIAQRAAAMDGRLRIAYVAGQLHQSLLRRVLAAHDPQRAQVFFYTNQPWPGLPAHVHPQPLVPGARAGSCAANRSDVVIDAGGLHPFEGQFELLQAYARRLAPVQVGWLGCWGSSGGLFDALLADVVAIPPLHEARYEEAVLRVAGGHWCWDPPLAAPDVSPLPALGRGSVTYGVTARSLRLGGSCLDAFARVVAATPQAVIRLIGEIALDWPTRRDVLARMQAQGVTAGRVFFDPFALQADYLAWLGRVDIVLDSFPGNGGLSLLDPLWMGVPVVTLAGAWAGARQGASLLTALGVAQWITESEAEFCAVAVALAGDLVALAAHRASLRSRLLASPLVDGRRVASQIESLCARLKQGSAAAAVAADPKERSKAQAQAALSTWLKLPRTIDLPAPGLGELADTDTDTDTDAAPELSVIVVLFNQAGLSRRTLQALADQRGAGFETIVVDNASSDRTAELLDRVRGARILRNPDNRGFLQAARQGADAARGRYLVFLNSDAILQEGALAATVRALRDDPGIGALGGRIVLTDGGLQEAGNVVFRDGSTGGIGRGEDAFGHAARAARATDYVSGVFLATPASLWRMLGGFDEAFAPAYYEDTDYCLRVWQAGFRVVYEPAVLLEHLEWGSATGDSATVLMKRNREVFRARYAEWLQHQPRQRSPSLALALDGDRWRSPDDVPRRPRVLFLDNEVPHMVRGGGLPRARLMLQALRDWPVTLFPLWSPHDDWRAVYASLPGGVEVALGYGMAGLEGFLERRRDIYDVLVVSRPPNLQALRPLRQRRPELFAGMRLVYDAEALFALREIAMAGVLGKPLPRAAARARVDAELALAAGASDVLVVSQRDARYFDAAGHRTHVVSHCIAPRRAAPGVAGRAGLLFVGALHPGTPNEDGLLWFIREVMPLLRRRLATPPVLTVVGVCLSDRIAALACTDVRVLGPQETLEPYCDAARVFVAPVRFAGGVPAKVIEAAAAGLPTVASALLVRQLQWRDGLDVLGARDAPAFAAAIIRLLQDDALWQRQQLAAWDQCGLRYSPELFGRTLRSVLAGEPEPGP